MLGHLDKKSLKCLHIDSDSKTRFVKRNSQVPILAKNKLMIQKKFISQWILVPIKLNDGLILHVGRIASVWSKGKSGDCMECSCQTNATAPDMGNKDDSKTAC